MSLLLVLQARGPLTAAELAEAHEVSVRTIYRDMADLAAAGVPVSAERGSSGGFRLLDGYRTNLTGLTADEAGALLLTGAAGPAAELGLGTLLATTRLKLLAAVPPRLREVATRAEQRFHLEPGRWAHHLPVDQAHLQAVARAVWEDRQLRIAHERADGDVKQRRLHPLGLVHKTGTWYLVAARDEAPRVYRVDRIRAAHVLDATAHRPDGFDLIAFWSGWEAEYAAGLPTFTARVRLGPLAQRYRDSLGAIAPRAVEEVTPEPDGWVRQTLLFDSRDVAVAALLALSPEVEVLAPAELRDHLGAAAQRVIERCRSTGIAPDAADA